MIVLIIFIVAIILFACLCCDSTDNDKNNENKKEMTETDLILCITHFCKENGFIEKDYELEMYSPTEKVKDDLFDEVFDEVFEMYCTRTMYLTRCIKNCVTGEEITVVISKRKYNIRPINKLDEYWRPIPYKLDESYIVFYFCYSKREIEKVELEKQIEKLNIPKYISCNFNVHNNCLIFYIEDKKVEDLTILRNDLTKDKILQNVEECKKRYAQKHEKAKSIRNQIRNQIQNIFI